MKDNRCNRCAHPKYAHKGQCWVSRCHCENFVPWRGTDSTAIEFECVCSIVNGYQAMFGAPFADWGAIEIMAR